MQHSQEKQPASQSSAAEAGKASSGTPAEPSVTPPQAPVLPREIGGREGPEPTRFGDWEKAGRCIDF